MIVSPTESAAEPEIVVLPDGAACSAAAAERIARSLSDAVAARGVAHWATTGGSAPGGIYRVLTGSPYRDGVPWADVHLWWGDDRHVPHDHPLSNVKPAADILLRIGALSGESGSGAAGSDIVGGRSEGVPIPAPSVHPMPTGEAIGEGRGPDWVAERYVEMLRADGPPAVDGWPAFDVVLLGVGPDGHVLSVFPGSEALDRREWALAIPAPTHVEPHVARVTLNPGILEVARLTLVVCHGAAKAEILGRVLGPERDPRRWPAQLARRPGATWILDEAAAAGLPR